MQSSTTAPQPTPSTSTAEFYCSQGIIKYCSPADTNFYLEPPPPFFSDDDDSSPSGSRVSPLMIGLITVLVAAFLLLSYYTFAYKYCKRRRRSSRWSRNQEDDELRLQTRLHQLVLQDTAAASLQFTAPPTVNSNGGLNEQFIRSITVFKYKRGDGLVESTDCAVCLTEFIEDESLRLMTNCQHAFHPPCIDTWLRSHSNCPICRASIIAAPPPPPLPIRRPPQTAVSRMRVHSGGDVVVVVDGSNRDRVRELDIRQPENATTVEVESDVDLCAVIEKESGRGLSP